MRPCLKKGGERIGKMYQELKVFTALARGPRFSPQPPHSGLQLPATPVPEEDTPTFTSAGSCTNMLHINSHRHTLSPTQKC